MFDYETLRVIWWLFMGVLICGFILSGGFDLGVGILLPFFGRDDMQRRVMLNTIGPTWEGNQVWLVTLGGAMFAVWPLVYATLFSGLYLAMILVLFTLFLRPPAFDYRGKLESPKWRSTWDWVLFTGSAVPTLLLGVLVGNLIRGVPFHLNHELRSFYDGSFFDLLNPFSLLCGVLAVLLLMLHGAIYLQWRTEGELYFRARAFISKFGVIILGALTLLAIWVLLSMEVYRLPNDALFNAASNPLAKTVEKQSGGWLAHFFLHPWMLFAPIMAYAGLWTAYLLAREHTCRAAFISSCLGLIGVLFTVGFGMFPFLLISSTDPGSSLTIWDASASHLTLKITFWITIVFLPIVLMYTRWAYKVMWGPVTDKMISQDKHGWY
ncbi:cytochrome d ubiquinol oxidase subunit II [Methylotuvimicrobium sp. KM1]|uniref:cytochrome d ubiquinol oxidase subunit II n=1 Tax=Methylotuvimicrobium sp. KM1 TaxID=3377707 RepID=UPI00384B45D1